jgi:malonate transporter
MLNLIGQTASGVALFVAGLMLAAHTVKLNRVVSINAALKSVGQPALMLAVMLLFGLTNSLGAEAVAIAALPSATIAVILAGRYKVFESEAGSTLISTSFLMIGVVPLFQCIQGLV